MQADVLEIPSRDVCSGYNLHTVEPGFKLYYGSAKFKSMNATRRMFGEPRMKFPSDRNFFLSTSEVAMKYTSSFNNPKEYFGRNPPVTFTGDNIHQYVTTKKTKFVIFNDPVNIDLLLFTDPHSPFNYINRASHIFPGGSGVTAVTGRRERNAIRDYLVHRNGELKHPALTDDTIEIPADIDRSMFGILLLATGFYRGGVKRDSDYSYDFYIADLFRQYFEPKGVDGWWQQSEPEFYEEYCIFTPAKILEYIDRGAASATGYIPKSDARKQDCHIAAMCDNPLKFEKEGQKTLHRIYREMQRYPNASDIHHTGKTIADHSVWVTRTVYNWMAYQDEPWTSDIWSEFRETVLLAAFLHDIGKIGDQDPRPPAEKGGNTQHPMKGYRYLTGDADFCSLKDGCKKFIGYYGLKIPDAVFPVIATVVALHHHFGELLLQYSEYRVTPPGLELIRTNFDLATYSVNGPGFIHTILGCIVELKYIIVLHSVFQILRRHDLGGIFRNNRDNLEQLLRILCAVGAADVFGAYPVEASRYNQTPADVLDLEVIFSPTESSRENLDIDRPYYKFAYGTRGLVERDRLVEYSRVVVNYDALCEAWDSLHQYMQCVQQNRMDKVPAIYRSLPAETPTEYLTSLFCLLKVGATKVEAPRAEQYRPRDATLLDVFAKEGATDVSWSKGISLYLMTNAEQLSKKQMALIAKLQDHHIDIIHS